MNRALRLLARKESPSDGRRPLENGGLPTISRWDLWKCRLAWRTVSTDIEIASRTYAPSHETDDSFGSRVPDSPLIPPQQVRDARPLHQRAGHLASRTLLKRRFNRHVGKIERGGRESLKFEPA